MITPTLDCALAETPAALDDVYRLRHCCYLRSGAIEPRPDQRFHDAYDQLPNHFNFLLRKPGEGSLATVRISVVHPQRNWNRAPSISVFGDHPSFSEIAGRSFVEASRLCFGKNAGRDLFYRLLGNMTAMADRYEVEWLVACPRVEHSAVYQRLFGFRPLAPPRKYFGVNFETELLGVRREEIREAADKVRWMREAWAAASEEMRQR